MLFCRGVTFKLIVNSLFLLWVAGRHLGAAGWFTVGSGSCIPHWLQNLTFHSRYFGIQYNLSHFIGSSLLFLISIPLTALLSHFPSSLWTCSSFLFSILFLPFPAITTSLEFFFFWCIYPWFHSYLHTFDCFFTHSVITSSSHSSFSFSFTWWLLPRFFFSELCLIPCLPTDPW